MRYLQQSITGIALIIGSFSAAIPALAEYPGIYWINKSLSTSVEGCFQRAERAMQSQGLEEVERTKSDVWGHTDNASAVIICSKSNQGTTATIMVTGDNSEELKQIRAGLNKSL